MSVLATATPAGPDEAALLARFGIDSSALLGSGGESRVFALDEGRVLRIFGGIHGEDGHLELISLVNQLATVDIGVLTPLVLDHGIEGRQEFTIDRRMPGVSLAEWLRLPHEEDDRRALLLDYLDVAGRLRLLPLPEQGPDSGQLAGQVQRFEQLVNTDRLPARATLVELLNDRAAIGITHSNGLLAAAMPDLAEQVDRLLDQLDARRVQPAFVHADYFPGNVMVSDGRISGVLDISVHALAADPVMDEVAAVCFLDQVNYAGAASDVAWLEDELVARLGEQAWLISAYRRWYGLYYSMDHALIEWAVAQFRRPAASITSA